MRRPFASITTVALVAAAVVLLGTGLVLRENGRHRFEGRDAFAARVERSERPMNPKLIVAHWRSEIAAQRFIADRDRLLSRVLLGSTLLVVLALAGSQWEARRAATADVARTPVS